MAASAPLDCERIPQNLSEGDAFRRSWKGQPAFPSQTYLLQRCRDSANNRFSQKLFSHFLRLLPVAPLWRGAVRQHTTALSRRSRTLSGCYKRDASCELSRLRQDIKERGFTAFDHLDNTL